MAAAPRLKQLLVPGYSATSVFNIKASALRSDLRILLANWFSEGMQRALKGSAKLKYFQHAGAMLTADGSDDHLIKLEAAPPVYKLAIPRPQQ